MKIAFTTEYSYPSKCGVWNTVYNTAKELQKKGHEIHIFSSNIIKGTSQKSKSYEIIEGITYHRFPVLFKIGENGRVWLFQKHLKNLKPDIIHSHSFRHFHSCLTPFIAKKLKIPCYLTTHGPFLEDGVRNSFTQLLVDSFDLISGRYVLNSYRKVFAISKWEIPFLLTLGCKKNKIKFLPNGISKEFLKIKIKSSNNVLFMGRISPIKNLETILKVAKELPKFKFTIYGPIEKGYTLESNLENTKIINKPYSEKEEIKELGENSIFILPSKTESVPLSLLEAMSAGLVCISSNTQGGLELIDNGKNGFIFKTGNVKELKSIILKLENARLFNKISIAAKKTFKKRTWDRLINKLEKTYKKDLLVKNF